jgi:hypothetical protein
MLRCRPTPAPVFGCVLPSAGPAGLGGAGRVPAGIAVLCPTGLPSGVAAADPAAAVGVGGWPASHTSTTAIASACCCARRRPASPPSSCTSSVNRGGPGRGRRPRLRPWLAAAAAGLRAGGLGQGSGLGMYGSLLAVDGGWRRWPRSTAAFHGWGVSHPIPIVSRSRRSGCPRGRLLQRRRACRPDDDQAPRLHDEVALSAQRHGDPANPRMDRGRAAWLARVAQRNWAAHARRNRPAPARWRRIGSITRRSPTVQAVSGSFIRRLPATRWRRRG